MIAAARCFYHAERMAAARCLACRNNFCRECVTEHQGRLVCASCLRRLGPGEMASSAWRRKVLLPVMAAAALLGTWLMFYAAGWALEYLTSPAPKSLAL